MTPNTKIQALIKSMGIIPEDEHYEVAEAVIRECAKTIRDSVQTMERGKIRASVAHAATLIEEHFGVEG
jgi:hypothetical protein